MSSSAIPLGDAWSLRRLIRRTGLVRLALGTAILACAVTAVIEGGPPSNRSRPLLPEGSDGIVVLDLSASASAAEYNRIHAYLTEIVKSRGRFGLVLFSDTAYEAMPPATPATAFATVARYFQGPVYPTSPWASGFSLGTSISQGLDLARSIIVDNGLRRRDVWLISDLNDAGTDKPLLTAALHAYLAARIDLHVLGVNAARADIARYRRLFGAQSPVVAVRPLAVVPRKERSYRFPVSFAAVAGVLAILFALNELLNSPLRWRSRRASSPAEPTLELSA